MLSGSGKGPWKSIPCKVFGVHHRDIEETAFRFFDCRISILDLPRSSIRSFLCTTNEQSLDIRLRFSGEYARKWFIIGLINLMFPEGVVGILEPAARDEETGSGALLGCLV
jgi:hypothetical protein